MCCAGLRDFVEGVVINYIATNTVAPPVGGHHAVFTFLRCGRIAGTGAVVARVIATPYLRKRFQVKPRSAVVASGFEVESVVLERVTETSAPIRGIHEPVYVRRHLAEAEIVGINVAGVISVNIDEDQRISGGGRGAASRKRGI